MVTLVHSVNGVPFLWVVICDRFLENLPKRTDNFFPSNLLIKA